MNHRKLTAEGIRSLAGPNRPPSRRDISMPLLVIENIESLKDFVGREISTTDWFEMTQERIRQFSETTEDRQWIHVDQERARRESPYGTTIAHGFLTLSLLAYFSQQAFEIKSGVSTVINYGLNRVRFPAPVPAGSMIRARFTPAIARGRRQLPRSRLFRRGGGSKPRKVRAGASPVAWRSG